MSNIKLMNGDICPLEMHKVRIVQSLNLVPIEQRLNAIKDAGFNTFSLRNRDIFLDMLTDSGVNAMSDNQLASMMIADDSYAGSETFFKLEKTLQELFNKKFFLPAHQGRACENILCKTLVNKGDVVPMNYHFTTTKSHIEINGGSVVELLKLEGLNLHSTNPFKGNMDTAQLEAIIKKVGATKIPFVRMEAGTNLIGGQPFSLENLTEVANICKKHNIKLVLDASLLSDNLYFLKVREEKCKAMSIEEITLAISNLCDIVYFSARKLGSAKGGAIITNNEADFKLMRELIPLYEGFLTYGGMSVREMEAINVGLKETMDINNISQGPDFISFMVDELLKNNIPVVTPAGGLGCHIDVKQFLPHIPQGEYPAGALACALFLISGVRGMERGTLSEDRNADGSDHLANVELLRLALPRRVFTMSQIKYTVDRLIWLFNNRELVGGLKFVEEPKILRFFVGKLDTTSNWPEQLMNKFKKDFGDSL